MEFLGKINLWPQPDFDSSTGFTSVGAGWSITGGEAVGNGAGGNIAINPGAQIITGLQYKSEIEISAYTSGTAWTPYDGSGSAAATQGNSVGTHTKIFTSTRTDQLYITSTSFVGAVTYASCFQYLGTATMEQEGFRFYDDDGNEASASPLAAQDTNVSVALDTNVVLRMLVDATAGIDYKQYQLQYKLSTDTDYAAVPVATGSTVAKGNTGTATGAVADVSPAWPTHAIGDTGFLIVETTGGQGPGLSAPAGFKFLCTSGTGTTTAGVRVTVYYCQATSASMPAPTVTNPGNHVYAQIVTVTGAASNQPWDVFAIDAKASADTSASAPSVTTTVDGCLILNIIGRDNDSAAAAFSAPANASLSNVSEWSGTDAGTALGNGGGFVVITGEKATAGATGVTTATVTSSINASITIAVKPIAAGSGPIVISPSTNVAAGGEATTARLTAPGARSTGDFAVGRLSDDRNDLGASIATDKYTELAWILKAQSPAEDGDIYQFRVVVDDTPVDTYSVTPQLTVGTGGEEPEIDASALMLLGVG